MDAYQKLDLLSQQAAIEEDEHASSYACPIAETSIQGNKTFARIPEVSKVHRSGGGQFRLLKTVLSSACERNCNYCAFRAGRDFRRATLKPDEMARLFFQMHIAGVAEGLFLSSGIAGSSLRTQDRLIDTAEILRKKFGYRGYLHLKIMPGAEMAQVERAMRLANRVSINLEAPNPTRLVKLAPRKDFSNELLPPLTWASQFRREQAHRNHYSRFRTSLATQIVVGPAGENDLEILNTTAYLFQQLGLARVYLSAFTPVTGTPLENHPAENPLREFRLYQASFLLRDYGYSMEDFGYMPDGFLPLDIDPKLAWAKAHLTEKPLEINTASRRIKFKEIGELRALGIIVDRVIPFILLDGKRPDYQLRIW